MPKFRFAGGRLVQSFPLIRIDPSVGVSRPAMILSRVVFPHPDGPRILINSPFSMSMDTFFQRNLAVKYFTYVFIDKNAI